MSDKTGAEIDQAQMVQVRNILHAAGECHSYETAKDIARVLRERDELRARLTESEAKIDQWQKRLTVTWDEVARLRAQIETWGRIWNDPELLTARVEALRDGTADLGQT